MTFAWPHLLWLLALPAGLLAWEWSARRRAAFLGHPKIQQAEAGLRSLRLRPAAGGASRRRPKAALCAGLALCIAALARPQWGRIEEPAIGEAREIVIALDLSRSMLTPDVKPSRLDRAKLLVESLLDRLQGERVGLVVFSGTAFLQSPLSSDYEILREFLSSLEPGYLPVGGTDYGAMIDTAAKAFGAQGDADRYLIVLSDGGATDEDWRSHMSRLEEKGIRVVGLGVGTARGGLIPDGSGGFVKDERGAIVKSSLESGTLRELASRTGGEYRDAADWIDLAALLRRTVEAGRKGRFLERNTVLRIERFQWLLAPGLLCLLASFWLEFPVRPKPREVKLEHARDAERPGNEAPRLAGSVCFLAVLLALAGASPCRAQGGDDQTEAPADAAPLAETVGRLANANERTARDWKELSEETIDWGQRSLDARQPVPAGPIRDGLAAVDAGAALDSKAADWPKLRSELEVFLRNPPRQNPPPQRKQSPRAQNRQNQQKPGPSNDRPTPGSGSDQERQGQPPSRPPKGGNAFGSMRQSQPPPASTGTQKVGGEPEHPRNDPARADPQLEASLEKLDRLKDQDSPAALYQMIERNEPHRLEKPAKDW